MVSGDSPPDQKLIPTTWSIPGSSPQTIIHRPVSQVSRSTLKPTLRHKVYSSIPHGRRSARRVEYLNRILLHPLLHFFQVLDGDVETFRIKYSYASIARPLKLSYVSTWRNLHPHLFPTPFSLPHSFSSFFSGHFSLNQPPPKTPPSPHCRLPGSSSPTMRQPWITTGPKLLLSHLDG